MYSQRHVPNQNLDPSAFWERFGVGVCKSIDPSAEALVTKYHVVNSNSETLSMQLDFAGKKYFVKHRSLANKSLITPHKVEREALRILGAAKLSPRLISYSDDNLILIQEFVKGENIRAVIDSRSLRTFCKSTGKWLRKYNKIAPYRKASGNWFDYLTHYPILLSSASISAAREFLETMTFERHVLARNSGVLSDLVLRPNGSVRSTNFANCQFKPSGWDLLLTARAFSQLYPDETELITSQLVAGFCGGSKDAAARWESLIKVFLIGLVLETGTNKSPSPAELGLKAFNNGNKEPAEIVATCTHLESHFVSQDKSVLKEFRTHVRVLAKAVLAKGDDHEPKPSNAMDEPKAGCAALCAACQGDCCQMGLVRNAFIEEHVVGRLLKQKPGCKPKDLIERYEQHIPKEHVSGSCFFHGSKGCSLPRDMRSDICNRFACGSARNLLRKIEETGAEDVLCIAGYGRNFKKAMRSRNGQVSEVPVDQLSAQIPPKPGEVSQRSESAN